MAEPYQSLYRRYRSRRFDELKGQEHVVRALKTAVQEDRVGHAYLFSGPRGTGKTSTARILAKVLNCETPKDGEPCGVCPNCEAVDQGRIVDWLVELDAASNSGVADIRELIDRIPLGTSGNRKVVILDEVHMLTKGAANALLKSLEEPPPHVVFILATTNPQDLLPTIKSRTQHFEFDLLPSDVLAEHIRHVIADAGLGLGEDAVQHVVRLGAGSARDALSALDQVAAMGGVVERAHPIEAILDALVQRDAGAALAGVAAAVEAGREPRSLGEALIGRLRDAFLAVMGAPDRRLPQEDLERAATLGGALGPAGLTRALEVLGESLIELSKKPDPRIVLEVALVRLCRADADRSLDAVLDRLERLERAVASGEAVASGSAADPPAGPPPSSGGAGGAGERPADGARAQLAKARSAAPTKGRATKAAAPAPAPGGGKPSGRGRAAADPKAPAADPADPPPAAAAAAAGGVPSRDELTLAWGDAVLGVLSKGARAIFSTGRFVEGDGTAAVFALANKPMRDHCEGKRAEVEKALATHFGRPVPLKLVTDADVGDQPAPERGRRSGRGSKRAAAPEPDPEDIGNVHELEDAPSASTGAQRLAEAFPGAELLDEP